MCDVVVAIAPITEGRRSQPVHNRACEFLASFAERDMVHVWTISTLSGCGVRLGRHYEAGSRRRAPGQSGDWMDPPSL